MQLERTAFFPHLQQSPCIANTKSEIETFIDEISSKFPESCRPEAVTLATKIFATLDEAHQVLPYEGYKRFVVCLSNQKPIPHGEFKEMVKKVVALERSQLEDAIINNPEKYSDFFTLGCKFGKDFPIEYLYKIFDSLIYSKRDKFSWEQVKLIDKAYRKTKHPISVDDDEYLQIGDNTRIRKMLFYKISPIRANSGKLSGFQKPLSFSLWLKSRYSSGFRYLTFNPPCISIVLPHFQDAEKFKIEKYRHWLIDQLDSTIPDNRLKIYHAVAYQIGRELELNAFWLRLLKLKFGCSFTSSKESDNFAETSRGYSGQETQVGITDAVVMKRNYHPIGSSEIVYCIVTVEGNEEKKTKLAICSEKGIVEQDFFNIFFEEADFEITQIPVVPMGGP